MALTIEDGTGVNGADSFVTGAEYVAEVAALFGETVTANEPAIRRAFLYLKSLNWKADYPFPTLGGDIPAVCTCGFFFLAGLFSIVPPRWSQHCFLLFQLGDIISSFGRDVGG